MQVKFNSVKASPQNKFIPKANPVYFGRRAVIEELSELVYGYTLRDGEIVASRCPRCLDKIKVAIAPFTERQKPVPFVLPAFPFKSPSPNKTFLQSADMAEEQSLSFLHKLTLKAREIYKQGIRINIFSDGLMFTPIKGVSDKTAIDYSVGVQEMIEKLGASDIKLMTLDRVCPDSYDSMRSEILRRYKASSIKIKSRVQDDKGLNDFFCRLHRFYTEERKGQFPQLSNSQNAREGKRVAYEIMQASEAFSNFIAEQMPEAARLSCHPQPHDSAKIGIRLFENGENATPWHNVAVRRIDGSFVLMKREAAEKLGLQLIKDSKTGNPSYYQANL